MPDKISLQLGNELLTNIENYTVNVSFFQTPNNFTMQVGQGFNKNPFKKSFEGMLSEAGFGDPLIALQQQVGRTAAEVLQKFRLNSPFSLFINDVLQFSGVLEKISIAEKTGTTFLLEGRDYLKFAHDDQFTEDTSYYGLSYRDLIDKAMESVRALDGYTLFFDSALIARSGKTGYPSLKDIVSEVTSDRKIEHKVHATMGTTKLQFMKTYLDRAGIFIVPLPKPKHFFVGTANSQQPPKTSLYRNPLGANADLDFYSNDIGPPRYARYTVFSRKIGPKKHGVNIKGVAEDPEMVALGVTSEFSFRDSSCASQKQAEIRAKKLMAEARRQQNQLRFTVEGHTFDGPEGPELFTPNTLVFINDLVADINGLFWIETVNFSRGPMGTLTRLTLLRQEDVDILYNLQGEVSF